MKKKQTKNTRVLGIYFYLDPSKRLILNLKLNFKL